MVHNAFVRPLFKQLLRIFPRQRASASVEAPVDPPCSLRSSTGDRSGARRDASGRFACLVGAGALVLAACSNEPASPGTGGTSSGSGGTTASGGASASGGAGATPDGGGAGTGGAVTPPPPPEWPLPALKLTQIASGIRWGTFLTSAPGDTSRLFVLERLGVIRVIKNGALQATPFLDLSSLVGAEDNNYDEQGLLGLAFHPEYAENGRFFVYYTDGSGNNVVATHVVDAANPDRAAEGSPEALLTITHPHLNHNAGMLSFGPDGFLYVGVGDGGASDPSVADPDMQGQNPGTNLAALLRLDVDSSYPEAVAPPGNTQGYVYDYGLRNPWRFSFDAATGDLYIADVGHEAFEEINLHPRGAGPMNFGWSQTEGNACHRAGCQPESYAAPLHEYSLPAGQAVIGGYVYRGKAIPKLRGTYLYADHVHRKTYALQWYDGQLLNQAEISSDLGSEMLTGISSFGQDANGELYVVEYQSDETSPGRIFRIDPE